MSWEKKREVLCLTVVFPPSPPCSCRSQRQRCLHEQKIVLAEYRGIALVNTLSARVGKRQLWVEFIASFVCNCTCHSTFPLRARTYCPSGSRRLFVDRVRASCLFSSLSVFASNSLCSRFSCILLILRATAPTMLMVVVTDWLGCWWWVYIVWRRADRDLFSLFALSVGLFLLHLLFSGLFTLCVCAWFSLRTRRQSERGRERERCAFVYYRLKRGETYNDLRTFIYISRHSRVYK